MPGDEDGRVRTQGIDIYHTVVADLIDQTKKVWKLEVLHELFDEDQVARICSIPIVRGTYSDEIIWRLEGSGCYRLLQSAHHITASHISGFFTAVWSVELPSKLLCAFNLASSPAVDRLVGIVLYCWSYIGYCRDLGLFPMDSASYPAIKFNFDSAFNQQSSSAISGAIWRNSEGLILAACAIPHNNVPDAFVAEALACQQMVQSAKDVGFSNVIIEGDSRTVIKKINDGSIIAPIIADIKELAKYFGAISFCFVNKVAHALTRECHYCHVCVTGLKKLQWKRLLRLRLIGGFCSLLMSSFVCYHGPFVSFLGNSFICTT
ncbi:hypothetical protein GQ457_14G005030 [Hibiscus cannabinus]